MSKNLPQVSNIKIFREVGNIKGNGIFVHIIDITPSSST
jgi:hypothetical protein